MVAHRHALMIYFLLLEMIFCFFDIVEGIELNVLDAHSSDFTFFIDTLSVFHGRYLSMIRESEYVAQGTILTCS